MHARRFADRISQRLEALADPVKAAQMAAYMKTQAPFWGVQAPERDAILREVCLEGLAPLTCAAQVIEVVEALWSKPHREERALAVRLLRRQVRRFDAADLPWIEGVIRRGAWWDTVDELAAHVVGPLVARDPDAGWPVMDAWIMDEDKWVCRAALLCQLGRGRAARQDKLFEHVRRCAPSSPLASQALTAPELARRALCADFFIRKAIGWALRDHARHEPEAVRGLVQELGPSLSALSRREALKHVVASAPGA